MQLLDIFLFVTLTSLGFSKVKAHPSSRLSQHEEIFNGKSYFLFYEPLSTWTDAWRTCIEQGLTLTKIESPEHLTFLIQLVNVTQGDGRAWIGATRLNRTDFVWIDNEEPLPRYIWATSSEPNNSSGNETCVEVWNNSESYQGANDSIERLLKTFICTTVDEPIATTETSTAPSTTTEEAEEVTEKPYPSLCLLPGSFPDPDDCQKYRVCDYNEVGDLWELVYKCEGDKVWCTEKTICEDPAFCPCLINHNILY